VLPGRLGVRFALETLFIVALAVGAGLADLRPAFIVLVMAAAWLLVALIELAAERVARSPVSYLLPAEPAAAETGPEAEAEHVFGPPVEERTVVAPPQSLEDTQEPAARDEPASEPEPVPAEPETEPEEVRAEADSEADSLELSPRRRLPSLLRRSQEPEALPEPEPTEDEAEPEPEPATAGRLRSLFHRREQEPEPIPEPPPRHVKLLPRRPAPEQAARKVSDVFGDDSADAEETAG
jgi:hypothetical protein